MYGSVYDWHTLEGPCVRKYADRYYCFYSGGRWENDTYGVDYGVADNVWGPYSGVDGATGPRVLRTIPGTLHGPGHNSLVVGPDGRDYIVFHAWDPAMTARRMFVRRLEWTAEGPRAT
jgi:GH43 family beta-xylosidase